VFENGGLFAALEQDDCETISCTILDSKDDVILLATVACFMRRELTRLNGYFEVTIPAYLSGDFETISINAFSSIHVSSRLVERLNPTSLANGTQNFR